MYDYKIKNNKNYSMQIFDGNGKMVAEYLLDHDRSISAQLSAMRRTIKKHLATGGTMYNYNW